jgi:hypothetical protein
MLLPPASGWWVVGGAGCSWSTLMSEFAAQICTRCPFLDCALQVLLCVYPFLWFQLYSFLFGQRRKKLAAGGRADKKRQ